LDNFLQGIQPKLLQHVERHSFPWFGIGFVLFNCQTKEIMAKTFPHLWTSSAPIPIKTDGIAEAQHQEEDSSFLVQDLPK
jgi:hypothetical protein